MRRESRTKEAQSKAELWRVRTEGDENNYCFISGGMKMKRVKCKNRDRNWSLEQGNKKIKTGSLAVLWSGRSTDKRYVSQASHDLWPCQPNNVSMISVVLLQTPRAASTCGRSSMATATDTSAADTLGRTLRRTAENTVVTWPASTAWLSRSSSEVRDQREPRRRSIWWQRWFLFIYLFISKQWCRTKNNY